MTLKRRGWSKKTEGRTVQKNKDSSSAVSTYLQRGSASTPGLKLHRCFCTLFFFQPQLSEMSEVI